MGFDQPRKVDRIACDCANRELRCRSGILVVAMVRKRPCEALFLENSMDAIEFPANALEPVAVKHKS